MRFVVLGTGLLGSALSEELASRRHERVALDHDASDAAGGLARAAAPLVRAGDVVVNAAAMTNLDACESREAEAMEVNGEEPGRLARLCRERGARFVHVSTDNVLDPVNVYARSKVLGERRVREEVGDEALVLRISTVFGPHGRDDFVRFVVKTLRAKGEVTAITDMMSSPTYTLDAARALLAAADANVRGVQQFVNEPRLSRFDFARLIQSTWRAPGVVRGVTMDEFKLFKAPRSRDSTMLSTLDAVHRAMPLQACLDDYLAGWG